MSRRARLHARAAEAWEAVLGRPAGARRDGPALAGGGARRTAARAWPAAVAAAERRCDLHAHEEARDLLRAALDAQASDPAADWTAGTTC